jgi:hypothetical protein
MQVVQYTEQVANGGMGLLTGSDTQLLIVASSKQDARAHRIRHKECRSCADVEHTIFKDVV